MYFLHTQYRDLLSKFSPPPYRVVLRNTQLSCIPPCCCGSSKVTAITILGDLGILGLYKGWNKGNKVFPLLRNHLIYATDLTRCKAPKGFKGSTWAKVRCGEVWVLCKAFPVETVVRPREPECIQWSPLQGNVVITAKGPRPKWGLRICTKTGLR
jgi:hypothetical protein